MCKTSLIAIHVLAFAALAGAGCYIYLNETDRLGKIKRNCYNKMMDVKDELKRKMK